MAAPDATRVTVLADRGFADCRLLEFLEEPGFGYVIRLRGDYLVTSASGEKRKAADWVGPGGRARTLRGATVTDAHRWKAATVACLKDKDMKEPWRLVASERRGARAMAALYAKRWGIETSFRDVKNPRFGMGLKEARVGRADRRDRMLLIGAMALALLTLLGAAGERLGYDRWLKPNTVKRRTHSLFRQGVMLYGHISQLAGRALRPLLEQFEELLLEQRVFRNVSASSRSSKMRGYLRPCPRSGRPSPQAHERASKEDSPRRQRLPLFRRVLPETARDSLPATTNRAGPPVPLCLGHYDPPASHPAPSRRQHLLLRRRERQTSAEGKLDHHIAREPAHFRLPFLIPRRPQAAQPLPRLLVRQTRWLERVHACVRRTLHRIMLVEVAHGERVQLLSQ